MLAGLPPHRLRLCQRVACARTGAVMRDGRAAADYIFGAAADQSLAVQLLAAATGVLAALTAMMLVRVAVATGATTYHAAAAASIGRRGATAARTASHRISLPAFIARLIRAPHCCARLFTVTFSFSCTLCACNMLQGTVGAQNEAPHGSQDSPTGHADDLTAQFAKAVSRARRVAGKPRPKGDILQPRRPAPSQWIRESGGILLELEALSDFLDSHLAGYLGIHRFGGSTVDDNHVLSPSQREQVDQHGIATVKACSKRCSNSLRGL